MPPGDASRSMPSGVMIRPNGSPGKLPDTTPAQTPRHSAARRFDPSETRMVRRRAMLRRFLVFSTLVLAARALAAPPPPPAGFQSRLESPDPGAPAQPDSLFAAVVAATPPLSIHRRPIGRPRGVRSDATLQSLDGDWRFQLESTDCTDEALCEGI